MVSSDRRRYELKARAERQQLTRQKIVEATAALHAEVGPARTTVADIARRAGVQRLTVYNHFPQAGDLFGACQAHFLTGNPPPDLRPPDDTTGALRHLERALRALYAWYRAHAELERNVHRDRHLIPELDELMRRTADVMYDTTAAAYATLLGHDSASTRAISSLTRVALDFNTWALLDDRGSSDEQTASLFTASIGALTNPGVPTRT